MTIVGTCTQQQNKVTSMIRCAKGIYSAPNKHICPHAQQELARLKAKANGMILECKREIEMVLFWKERQHLVVQKMEVL